MIGIIMEKNNAVCYDRIAVIYQLKCDYNVIETIYYDWNMNLIGKT